eukprot:GHVR01059846.1.p3 GENE.GHVR01059846.1~~GHVR01059846.1.p3  ORF type:complete len:109 (-),score=60.40 GHVR01059846.1:21-347(-)
MSSSCLLSSSIDIFLYVSLVFVCVLCVCVVCVCCVCVCCVCVCSGHLKGPLLLIELTNEFSFFFPFFVFRCYEMSHVCVCVCDVCVVCVCGVCVCGSNNSSFCVCVYV